MSSAGAAISAKSLSIPPTPQSSKSGCGLSRVLKIVLPILASLAGFVFLPLEAAVALTAVVTIGAIVYDWKTNCLKAPAINTPHIHVTHILGLGAKAPFNHVQVVFKTKKDLEEFCKEHESKFSDFAIVIRLKTDIAAVRILLKDPKDSKKSSVDITNVLTQIYKDADVFKGDGARMFEESRRA
jgi:hypothetical protein